jgi:hypothetical protein
VLPESESESDGDENDDDDESAPATYNDQRPSGLISALFAAVIRRKPSKPRKWTDNKATYVPNSHGALETAGPKQEPKENAWGSSPPASWRQWNQQPGPSSAHHTKKKEEKEGGAQRKQPNAGPRLSPDKKEDTDDIEQLFSLLKIRNK